MPHAIHDDSVANANMSRPSSTSTSSAVVAAAPAAAAAAFPRPAGVNADTLLAPETIGDQLSPSQSTFSFEESNPKSVQAPEHTVQFDDVKVTRPQTDLAAIATRHAPASGHVVQHTGGGSRRRAQYYEEQFAYKEDSSSTARDRVTKDAPIVAELRTNVIVCFTSARPSATACGLPCIYD